MSLHYGHYFWLCWYYGLGEKTVELKCHFYHIITKIHEEGNGTPLQYSCLEDPMDGGAWWAAVHGVSKSWRWLSDFTFTFHFHALEKEMATHSSVLAWRPPGTGEPGGLPSMGSHRVGHDWSDLAAAAATKIHAITWLIPVDVDLNNLAEVMFVRFVTLFSQNIFCIFSFLCISKIMCF